MKKGYVNGKSFGRFLVVAFVSLACLMLLTGPASASWNFLVPALEVRPNAAGVFELPAAQFNDGKAKYYVYKHSPSEWIRFFVVKSSDGVMRAAFDACDVCFSHKKGYVQQGDFMVCVNCGLKFQTTRINEVRGGCNPAGLNRTVKGGKVMFASQDVLAGLRYFK